MICEEETMKLEANMSIVIHPAYATTPAIPGSAIITW